MFHINNWPKAAEKEGYIYLLCAFAAIYLASPALGAFVLLLTPVFWSVHNAMSVGSGLRMTRKGYGDYRPTGYPPEST